MNVGKCLSSTPLIEVHFRYFSVPFYLHAMLKAASKVAVVIASIGEMCFNTLRTVRVI